MTNAQHNPGSPEKCLNFTYLDLCWFLIIQIAISPMKTKNIEDNEHIHTHLSGIISMTKGQVHSNGHFCTFMLLLLKVVDTVFMSVYWLFFDFNIFWPYVDLITFLIATLKRFVLSPFVPGHLEKQPSDISPGIPGRAEVRGDGRTSVCLSGLIACVPYQQPCQV